MKEYIGMVIAGTIGVCISWLGKKFITKSERKMQELNAKEKDIDVDDKLIDSYEKKAILLLENINRLEAAGERMFNELLNLRQERLESSKEIIAQKEKVIELISDLSKQREANIRIKECKDKLLDKYACSESPTCESRIILTDEKRKI